MKWAIAAGLAVLVLGGAIILVRRRSVPRGLPPRSRLQPPPSHIGDALGRGAGLRERAARIMHRHQARAEHDRAEARATSRRERAERLDEALAYADTVHLPLPDIGNAIPSVRRQMKQQARRVSAQGRDPLAWLQAFVRNIPRGNGWGIGDFLGELGAGVAGFVAAGPAGAAAGVAAREGID